MTSPSPHALKALEASLSTQIKRGEGNAEATVSCNSTLLHDCLALVRHTLKETTTA